MKDKFYKTYLVQRCKTPAEPVTARDAEAVEGGGLEVVGGQNDHLVLVGADCGPNQVLGVYETFIQFKAGLVSTSSNPGHLNKIL